MSEPKKQSLRDQIKALNKQSKAVSKTFPDKLVKIPRSDWPLDAPNTTDDIYQSNQYYVQLHSEEGGVKRLCICKWFLDDKAQAKNDISFSQIMAIKNELGFGDQDMAEVFPRESDRQRFGGMRIFFVPPFQIPYTFRNEKIVDKPASNIIITG